MKHTDIKIWETVYIKARKDFGDMMYSWFFLWDEPFAKRTISDYELEEAITENELKELIEKANNSFVPVVWEEYEFSQNWNVWKKTIFTGFSVDDVSIAYKYIRPIQKKCTIEIDEKHKEEVEQFIRNLK